MPLAYGAIVCRVPHTALAGQTLALYLGLIAVSVVVVGFILEAASDFANQVYIRTPRTTPSQHPLVVSDAIHHFATHATPAVRLLAKAAVIVALTYTPYVL
jgi:steroid 5-alpha reductase family enzyme